MNALIEWKDGRNIVVISHEDIRLEIELSDWLDLPAVQYAAALLSEGCMPSIPAAIGGPANKGA